MNVPHNQEHILEYCFSGLISATEKLFFRYRFFQMLKSAELKEYITFLNFKSVAFSKLATSIGKSNL